MLWIDAWSDLLEHLDREPRTLLLDPDWSERTVEEIQGLIQEQAYASQRASFTETYYRGRKALRVEFAPVKD